MSEELVDMELDIADDTYIRCLELFVETRLGREALDTYQRDLKDIDAPTKEQVEKATVHAVLNEMVVDAMFRKVKEMQEAGELPEELSEDEEA